MEADGRMAVLPKKEQILLRKELGNLQTNLNGIRNMKRTPDAVFVIDTNREAIAIHESRRLDIPVWARSIRTAIRTTSISASPPTTTPSARSACWLTSSPTPSSPAPAPPFPLRKWPLRPRPRLLRLPRLPLLLPNKHGA